MKQLLTLMTTLLMAMSINVQKLMTNLVLPSEPYDMVKVEGGKATIFNINQ